MAEIRQFQLLVTESLGACSCVEVLQESTYRDLQSTLTFAESVSCAVDGGAAEEIGCQQAHPH